jgi:ParB/RepB/Spo0J family partition protein
MGTKEDRLNEQARAEGWTSRGQKYRAAKAGVTDPAEWNARTTGSVITLDDDDLDVDEVGSEVVWTEQSLDDALTELPPLTLDLQGGDIGAVTELPIDRVLPAGDNPRRVVDIDPEMVDSIKAIGILQPLIVTVHPDQTGHWLIVAGHRRHAAAGSAGLTTVPALVREFTPIERVEAMLVENLQRKDLDPFDEAHGFQQLQQLGRTQREIADRVGRNQSHISRRLRLVDLEPGLVDHFTAGLVTLRVLEELAVLSPAVRHAAVGVIAKSPGIHESNIIPAAEKADATAEAQLLGEQSGLPEWTGKRWELSRCEQPQATHWTISEEYDAGRWMPVLQWGREIPRDIPGGTSAPTTDPAEAERRRQERELADAAAAARKARVAQRRTFIAAHLDILGDLAIRLMVPATDAYFYYEDEVSGALRLLGHDVPDLSADDDFSPIDAWNDLASQATTKRQTLRMFTARILDGADELFETPTRWQDKSWHSVYLAGLAAVGWDLDEVESAIVTAAADAAGITDEVTG